MQPPEALARLVQFRQEVYQSVLGQRQDSVFELLDAVCLGAGPTSLVRHSLSPAFRRRWSSVPDALADGTLRLGALHRLLTRTLPAPADGDRSVWAVDGTLGPRPFATTSPQRSYSDRPMAGRPDRGIVPSWEYQWLVALPETAGTWMLPLDVRRRGPTAPSPTQIAIAQLHDVLAHRPPAAGRPVVTFDSSY